MRLHRITIASIAFMTLLGPSTGARVQAQPRPAADAGAPQLPRRTPRLVSPEIAADRRVTVRLHAPDARKVLINYHDGKGHEAPMTRDDAGLWSATLGPLPPGLHEYYFVVDGLRMLDPNNGAVKAERAPRTSHMEIPGDPPLLSEWRDVPHGAVHLHHYRASASGRTHRLHVYTPPGYERDRAARYPVLALYHGFGDNDAGWVVNGRAALILDNLIATKAAAPMIVVMPDGHPIPPEGGAGEYPSWENCEATRQELLADVLPLVEARYRTKPGAANRAVAGLSMGGQHAINVGLTHPDRFAWVLAYSAGIRLRDELDARLKNAALLNKALRLFWIAIGKDDFLLERNREFVAQLRAAGVAHEFAETDGDHSWPVWRAYLGQTLPMLWKPRPPARR